MMGRCLQWLDGSGRRAGKPAWISELFSHLLPEVRSQGRRSRRGGAPGGVAVCCCLPAIREISRGLLTMRLSALRLPSSARGGKLKAHLAPRRENADAWLFEIVDQEIERDAANTLRVIRGLDPRIHPSSGRVLRRRWIAGSSPAMTRVAFPGRDAARSAASQNRDRTEHRRSLRPRLCSAPLRRSHSASKTRVNALMALRCVRGTRSVNLSLILIAETASPLAAFWRRIW